jgi:hypothetical protein
VSASDVEIGEVSAVGLMEIIVAVVRSVEGRGDHGRKEIARSTLLLLEEDLIDETFEDAPLLERNAMSVNYADFHLVFLSDL